MFVGVFSSFIKNRSQMQGSKRTYTDVNETNSFEYNAVMSLEIQ